MAVSQMGEVAERPRERMRRLGPGALGAQELVALVLGTGARGVNVLSLAEGILLHVGGVVGLARASPNQFELIHGVGPAQATRLCAAVELGRRCLGPPDELAVTVSSPTDVYQHLRGLTAQLEQEVFILICLDARNRVLRRIEIARGSLTQVEVHPRELFRALIREGAAAGVVAHNHPSGDPEPSSEDIELTRRVMAAGELVGIPILDHVVIGADGYVSIAERIAR